MGLRRGEVIGARYLLLEPLGEGGMGAVFRARDEHTGIEVAVKVLHTALVSDASSVERFRTEARAASRVAHPNICATLDAGTHDGAPYLVMELLEGRSLAAALEREGPFEPRRAAHTVIAILEALEAAHRAGVLHRDLKPENVYLLDEGGTSRVKLLDFGVAKLLGDDEARARLTRSGALVGTPAYMAPEQARGERDADARSDVWAVGVLAFELLTGVLPYESPNYPAMIVKIATGAPRSLSALRPGLDARLCAVLERALCAKRDERYPSARAMADALRAWLEGRTPARAVLTPVSARRVGLRVAMGAGVVLVMGAVVVAVGAARSATSASGHGVVLAAPTTRVQTAPAPSALHDEPRVAAREVADAAVRDDASAAPRMSAAVSASTSAAPTRRARVHGGLARQPDF